VQVPAAAEGLDGGEEDIRVRSLLPAVVVPQGGQGADPPEGAPGLSQDLLPVGHEEDAPELRTALSKALSQVLPRPVARTTSPAVVPLLPGPLQGLQGPGLDAVGRGRLRRLRLHPRELRDGRAPPLPVPPHPVAVHGPAPGVIPELLEGLHHLPKPLPVPGRDHPVVPLHPVLQGHLR
jgi:hypothetical protein